MFGVDFKLYVPRHLCIKLVHKNSKVETKFLNMCRLFCEREQKAARYYSLELSKYQVKGSSKNPEKVIILYAFCSEDAIELYFFLNYPERINTVNLERYSSRIWLLQGDQDLFNGVWKTYVGFCFRYAVKMFYRQFYEQIIIQVEVFTNINTIEFVQKRIALGDKVSVYMNSQVEWKALIWASSQLKVELYCSGFQGIVENVTTRVLLRNGDLTFPEVKHQFNTVCLEMD